GAYFLNYSSSDLILVMISGVVGYMFVILGIPLPPLVLALILGETTETTLRNSLVLSNGNISIFFQKPISAVFIALAAISLVYALIRNKRKQSAA
ncbi:MAG: tripartite tricarboxylate transporter permease, partial [Spirochaetia bacterium]|nr:tripartite tricarboxylate transporter permease [Spirochaetia bacterium]